MNRTLANLRGVLLDGRHPFFMSGEFRISSNTLFPMTAACILHQIGCILHQIRCILGCKEILFRPILGGYNYLTCSLFRVLRALYEVVFSVGIGKMPVFGVFFTIRWRSLKRDIQQIEVYSIPFCYKMCRYFIFSLYLCSIRSITEEVFPMGAYLPSEFPTRLDLGDCFLPLGNVGT